MAPRFAQVCLAMTLFGSVACAHSGPLVRDYTPASHEAARPRGQTSAVSAEILHVRYGREHAFIRVRVANASERRLSVPRAGILLQYGELELPLDLGQPAPAALSEVPAGGHVVFELAFHIGRPMHDIGRLVARGMRDGDQAIADLELTVPPQPASAASTQSSRR